MFGGQSLADSAQVHSAFGWRVEFAGPDELCLGAFPTRMEPSASAAPRSLTLFGTVVFLCFRRRRAQTFPISSTDFLSCLLTALPSLGLNG